MLGTLTGKFKQVLMENLPHSLDAVTHERLRLRYLFGVAILKLFNFIGGAWDIQWHIEIGRDSLFIPPHMLVIYAFIGGVALVISLIAYETALAANGQAQPHAVRVGPLRAPAAAFGILFGYSAALAFGGFDEWWHRTFGIDATLWSPPHLLIMFATVIVDFSLLLGITSSARRLGYHLTWKSPLTWGVVLIGAYAFESVNFQMGEAFIIGYRNDGVGLFGLLYPLLVGIFMPLSLLMLIQVTRRFWIGLPVLGLTLIFQYLATGIAALGFAILQPVSVIDEYVRLNPESTAAVSREFARLLGFNGLIGFHQAWTMSLAAAPLTLVALLHFSPWARRHPLVAAPVFSAGMVLFSFLWFEQIPALQNYPVTGWHVLQAVCLSALGGLVFGRLGLYLAERVQHPNIL